MTHISHKRDNDQRERDRARVAELMMQGYNHDDITRILFEETGLQLSRRQITYDVGIIRKRWQDSQVASYNEVVHEELARVDSLEKEIWKALRSGMSDTKARNLSIIRQIIEEVVESEEDVDAAMSRIRPFIELQGINPAFFSQILGVQQERRRILGIYAPTKVSGELAHHVTIKGYQNISPDDWPDVVEGKYEEVKHPQLSAG